MADDQNTNEQTAEEAQLPGNVVTLVDLQNVLVIMDLASSRGAFRGPELQPVGQLYNKINQFLQSALPPKEESTEETSTGGAE